MLLTSIELIRKGMKAGKSVKEMQKENLLKDYEAYESFIPQLNTDFWIDCVYQNYRETK